MPEAFAGINANALLIAIGAKYLIGDRVKHVADDEDDGPGIVLAVKVNPTHLSYIVSFSRHAGEPEYNEIELVAWTGKYQQPSTED